MKRIKKNKRVLFPNIIDGGNAIPLGDNYYFMQGRKHSQGGIDIGANNKNGLEVEGGEVMKVNPKSIKVFSAQPLLNGISPAQRVLNGQNPTDVFNAQENYKDRNNLKDDGTKAQNGIKLNNIHDSYMIDVPRTEPLQLLEYNPTSSQYQTRTYILPDVVVRPTLDQYRQVALKRARNTKVPNDNYETAVNLPLRTKSRLRRYYYKDKTIGDKIRRFGVIAAGRRPFNCINTITSFNNPNKTISDNVAFINNPQKYGYERINQKDSKPGDMVQLLDYDGTPYHAMQINGVSTKNGTIYGRDYQIGDTLYNESNGTDTYYVGTPIDRKHEEPKAYYRYTGNYKKEFGGDFTTDDAIKAAKTIGGYLPFIGTALDVKEFLDNPSWEQAGWTALGLASDIALGGSIRGIIRTVRNARKAQKTINTLRNLNIPINRSISNNYKNTLNDIINERTKYIKQTSKRTFKSITQNSLQNYTQNKKENGGNYKVNSLLDAIYANAKGEKQYGNPIENYNNTISENEAELLGYKKDYRGHRDDRVKYSNHPSHPSRGTFDKNNNFNLSDRGLNNSNYTLFGLRDGNQDGESVIKYNNSIVLPEITKTPNSVYIDNPYDNIAIKMKCGGRKKAQNGINYVVDSNGKSNVRYVSSTGGRAERSEALKTKKALNGTIVTLKPDDLYFEDPIITVPYLSNRHIRDLTNVNIKTKQDYNNINNSNTNTNNNDNNSKFKLDLFNNLNTSDLIEGGINTLGNIGSAIINNSMINSLKAPTMPVHNRAVKLKTNININPQLDKMREDLYNYETNINNNTNSSQLALARNQKARLSNITGINTLYGNKENMETELINKDRINQQTVANKNIDEYNKWLDTVNNFNNNVADKRSENFVNTIQNEINSVNNIFTRAEQRRQYDNNVAAYIASHPNVDPELLKAYGFNGINDELIRRKRIVRNRTNSNNPYLSTKTTDNI